MPDRRATRAVWALAQQGLRICTDAKVRGAYERFERHGLHERLADLYHPDVVNKIGGDGTEAS